MERGLERRFGTWVEIVGDLLLRRPGDLPIGLLLSELHASFGTNVSYNWADDDGAFGFELHQAVPGWPGHDDMELWAHQTRQMHPLIRWFAVTGDQSAMSLGRVPHQVGGSEGFHVMREQLAPFGIDQQLSIPYSLRGSGYRTFVLATTGPDFGDEDLDLARRIQPLLILLARQATVLEERQHGARTTQVAAEGVTDSLTGRELAVLALLERGLTAAAIAQRLGISPRTVHVHLNHLYRKLDVRDRMTAVRVAREQGILRTDHPGAERAGTPMDRRPPADPRPADERAFAWRPETSR